MTRILRSRFVVCVCMALASSFWMSAALPAAEVPADKQDLFEFLLAGLKHEREKLASGVFHAHGTRVFDDPRFERLQGDVRIFGAFDFASRSLRFDREAPVRTPAPSREAAAKWREAAVETARFCRTADFSAYYSSQRKEAVDIRQPDHEFQIPERVFFDVRCLGMYVWVGFVSGDDFETTVALFAKYPPDEVTDEGGGLHRVRWVFGDRQQRTLWINEQQGLSPVRFVVQVKGAPPGPDWDEEPILTNDATWQQVSGIWVPKTFRISEKLAVSEGERGQRKRIGYKVNTYSLAFDWESVNEPVDEKYFHYNDFAVEKGTYLTDWRSGEPVVVDVVGTHIPGLGLQSPPAGGMSAARVLVIAGSLLLAVCIVCWSWVRARRHRTR